MDDEKDIRKEVTLPHGWNDKQIDLGSVVQEKNDEQLGGMIIFVEPLYDGSGDADIIVEEHGEILKIARYDYEAARQTLENALKDISMAMVCRERRKEEGAR